MQKIPSFFSFIRSRVEVFVFRLREASEFWQRRLSIDDDAIFIPLLGSNADCKGKGAGH